MDKTAIDDLFVPRSTDVDTVVPRRGGAEQDEVDACIAALARVPYEDWHNPSSRKVRGEKLLTILRKLLDVVAKIEVSEYQTAAFLHTVLAVEFVHEALDQCEVSMSETDTAIRLAADEILRVRVFARRALMRVGS